MLIICKNWLVLRPPRSSTPGPAVGWERILGRLWASEHFLFIICKYSGCIVLLLGAVGEAGINSKGTVTFSRVLGLLHTLRGLQPDIAGGQRADCDPSQLWYGAWTFLDMFCDLFPRRKMTAESSLANGQLFTILCSANPTLLPSAKAERWSSWVKKKSDGGPLSIAVPMTTAGRAAAWNVLGDLWERAALRICSILKKNIYLWFFL